MDAHKLQVKLFATDTAAALSQESFIPIFHDWIKRKALPELMIDVANYAHVPKGPGVALIGHANDYFIDDSEGRRGLLFSRKRSAPAPDARLGDAFRRAIFAAQLLEREGPLGGKLRFRTDEFLFRINDRLAAPNTGETGGRLLPAIESFAETLFAGAPSHVVAIAPGKQLFSVTLSTTTPVDLETLLARLGGPPGPDASVVA